MLDKFVYFQGLSYLYVIIHTNKSQTMSIFQKDGYTNIGTKSAKTRFNILEGEWKGSQLEVYTYKDENRNLLLTTAKVVKIEKRDGAIFVLHLPFQDPFKMLFCEACPRLSQKKIEEQHERGLNIVQSENFSL